MKSTTWKLSARNALRRPVRTALTTGMVVFGVALLMISLTWIRGVMGQSLATATALGGHLRVVKPDFSAREELSPLEEHLPGVEQLAALVRRQSGVASAEPRITAGVTVTIGEELGDVFAMAVGANEGYFRDQLRAPQKLVQGRWLSGAEGEIVAGAKVVEQTGAKLGDELLLLGLTQDGSLSPLKGKLVGVVRAGGLIDRQLFLPLERLQWLTDIGDGATELLIYGRHYDQGPKLAAQLRAVPELAPLLVQAWDERDPWKSMFQQVQSMQAIIILVVVFLTALGIWNTMMMSVLERTHEVGVLRALGLSAGRTVGLFVGEALAIGVLGGLLGVVLGLGPSWLLQEKGIHLGEKTASNLGGIVAETLYGELSVQVVAMSFGLGLLMAVLGSVLPSIRAASIQPVSAMRSGR